MKTESRVRILVLVFVVLMAGRFGPGLVRSGASYVTNLWLHIIDPTRYWVRRLQEAKSDEGQREAVRALVKIGPPAVPHLIASLRRLGGASTQIVMCLGQLGSPAVPALMEAVGDPNPEMQSDAVRALGLMGHSAHPAISLLIKMLKDASPGDHSAVSRLTMDLIDTLGKIGPEVIAPATDALLLADDAHRWLFAAVLGRRVSGAEFTPQLQAVVAELRNALEHDEDSVRISAAFGLSALGRTASSAIPDLIRALKDPNHDVRRNACVALGRMGSEVAAAVPSLI
ncbi:MAG: HEAT repeat domain-containing protein, partial [Planctomycetes bacterium]|nr:HEAT repeat domain-containing protein [Planctomycetota bacterium]